VVGRGEAPVLQPGLPTAGLKAVIGVAFEEAGRMGNRRVGTEHLLLAILTEAQSIAAHVLEDRGVTPEKTRLEVERLQKLSTDEVPRRASKTPMLDEFGRDLTDLAGRDQLDPVIGREPECERVLQILSRRIKNNPALVGDAGVGKTAVAEGVAQQIVLGNVPEPLLHKRVVTLDLGAVVAGTKYRGEFEDRLQRIMTEIRDSREVVLFIDELHTLVGAGAAEGAIDAANLLKPMLARGELQCIGATTRDEYRRYVERDGALERRFQPVEVGEPSVSHCIDILRGLKPLYEKHHKVTITDAAVRAAALLGDRHVSDRVLPDKAIDIVDEAAARARTTRRDATEKAEPEVGEDEVGAIVASWTGIPVSRLIEPERARLLRMEDELHRRVVGQDEAVSVVSRAIRRARVGLKDPRHPIGSFIFLGPTGVGKTELARTLAWFLFDSEDSLVRLDMSEFSEHHSVARMVGSPPGYVGHDEGGQLTEAVRRRPYSVLLLDEVEKAHPDAFNMLLQIMEDGRLSDAAGRTVSFANTVVVMTSNLGTRQGRSELGFRPPAGDEAARDHHRMRERVGDELKRMFRPEFLNRLDAVVTFSALGREQLRRIVDLMLAELQQRLAERGIDLEVSEAAKDLLAGEGFDVAFGARPLRRTITAEIENPLSDRLLRGEVSGGDTVMVTPDGGDGLSLVVERRGAVR
jgi:ATP-dependent Clp protease ATP-binding subunit ClpC